MPCIDDVSFECVPTGDVDVCDESACAAHGSPIVVGLDDLMSSIALIPSKPGGLSEIMVKESNAYFNMTCHCPKCVVELIGRDVIDLCEVHASTIVTVSGCAIVVQLGRSTISRIAVGKGYSRLDTIA